MLVNYKKENVLTVECGKGEPKLVLVPGVNVIEDANWEKAKVNLAEHIKRSLVMPIEKVTKDKEGKEKKSYATPDEIPNEQIDDVVGAIQSEAQADKFVKASTKESVRAKAMNRKNDIAKELKNRAEK